VPSYADRMFSAEHLKQIAQQQTPSGTQAPTKAASKESLWPYLALYGGQGADIATTIQAGLDPRLEEKNPMGIGGVLGVKAAGTAALTYLMHKEAKAGNTYAQKMLGIIGGVAGLVPAMINVHTFAKVK
jgi:hypothetical protein